MQHILSPDTHNAVRLLLLRSRMLDEMAREARAQMVGVISRETGIDLDQEHWTLDEQRGILTPTTEETPAAEKDLSDGPAESA